LDKKVGQPLVRAARWAEKHWFGGWDDMHKLRFNQPEEDDVFFPRFSCRPLDVLFFRFAEYD